MKKNMVTTILFALLTILITVIAGCNGENPAIGPQPPQFQNLEGEFFGPYADGSGTKLGRLTILIDTDRSSSGIHVLQGSVILEGSPGCFTEGSFGVDANGSYDESTGTGNITAVGADFSTAILNFSIAPGFKELELQANASRFQNAGGQTCLTLETTILRKRNEIPPR